VAAEPWITVHDGFPLMATIEAIGAAANHRLELVHRVNEFTVVAELVAAGAGLALIPRWTARSHPGIVLRPMRGVHARRHIDALHRPERTARRAVRTTLANLETTAATIRRSSS
jgi:DNA-binding transcriptional LysR family regulator